VVLRGQGGRVNAVAISADSRWVVTGSDDKPARLWHLGATDPAAVLREHGGQGFSTFKEALAALVVESLAPIAAETQRLLADPATLDTLLRQGARRADAIADPIVAEAERLVGFSRV